MGCMPRQADRFLLGLIREKQDFGVTMKYEVALIFYSDCMMYQMLFHVHNFMLTECMLLDLRQTAKRAVGSSSRRCCWWPIRPQRQPLDGLRRPGEHPAEGNSNKSHPKNRITIHSYNDAHVITGRIRNGVGTWRRYDLVDRNGRL